MDKWNQVLKGVAAIVLSFVVGMMLGMVCGCSDLHAEENHAILAVSGFVEERDYYELNMILQFNRIMPFMLIGLDKYDNSSLCYGALLRLPVFGFELIGGGDIGVRSHWTGGSDRNLWIGAVRKNDYSRWQHLHAQCLYFRSSARGGVMVRNGCAVLMLEVVGYYFQYQTRFFDSSITSWDVRASAGVSL